MCQVKAERAAQEQAAAAALDKQARAAEEQARRAQQEAQEDNTVKPWAAWRMIW